MIHNTAVRLCIVAAIFPATYGLMSQAKFGLEPPGVEMPTWTFKEMPLQMGEWRGEPIELDPEIAAATGAAVIVNRLYRDPAGHAVSMHTAVFEKPIDSVMHTPIRCYRSNGFQDVDASWEELQLSKDVKLPVSMVTWEGKREKLIVVYWYQLGEHVLFDRADLGLGVRWALRGRAKWPAAIKVMLQIDGRNPREAIPAILDFATRLAQWENQPKHGLLIHAEAGRSDPSSSPSSPPRSGDKK